MRYAICDMHANGNVCFAFCFIRNYSFFFVMALAVPSHLKSNIISVVELTRAKRKTKIIQSITSWFKLHISNIAPLWHICHTLASLTSALFVEHGINVFVFGVCVDVKVWKNTFNHWKLPTYRTRKRIIMLHIFTFPTVRHPLHRHHIEMANITFPLQLAHARTQTVFQIQFPLSQREKQQLSIGGGVICLWRGVWSSNFLQLHHHRCQWAYC